jgi:haloalkane dehalogenase
MREEQVPVLDSWMHCRRTGDGAPIVFLHGNPTSSYLWRNVIPPLEAEGLCIAPDLIGMGKSGRPEIPYRFFDHARYLDAFLDGLDLRGATLVLHDWGSALGIHWAKRHEDRVAGIAMMEPILEHVGWKDFPPALVDLFKGFRTPDVGEKLILEENVFVEKVLPGAVFRKLGADEMAAYRTPFPDPHSRRPVLQWPRELPIEGEPADVIRVIEENARWLGESDVPKLLLTFDPGALVTAPAVERLRPRIRNLEIRKIGAGLHYVQEDHPGPIAEAIRDWRRRVVSMPTRSA